MDRGLGPTRHSQGVLGESGPSRTHPCSCLTVWVFLSCLTAGGEKAHDIFTICVSLSLTSVTLSFFHALIGPLLILPFLQLFLSVHSTRHQWPTSGLIGQLSDDFKSILFNSLPVGVRKMSYLLQLCYCLLSVTLVDCGNVFCAALCPECHE